MADGASRHSEAVDVLLEWTHGPVDWAVDHPFHELGRKLSREMGRNLPVLDLGMGMSVASFHLAGSFPCSHDLLMRLRGRCCQDSGACMRRMKVSLSSPGAVFLGLCRVICRTFVPCEGGVDGVSGIFCSVYVGKITEIRPHPTYWHEGLFF